MTKARHTLRHAGKPGCLMHQVIPGHGHGTADLAASKVTPHPGSSTAAAGNAPAFATGTGLRAQSGRMSTGTKAATFSKAAPETTR
jgi:hypothetical protein